MQDLFEVLRVLPSDYEDYGGNVKRWENDKLAYPDCSCGCRFFARLALPNSADWGVCCKLNAPRAGLLTWEHQAGLECFEEELAP